MWAEPSPHRFTCTRATPSSERTAPLQPYRHHAQLGGEQVRQVAEIEV